MRASARVALVGESSHGQLLLQRWSTGLDGVGLVAVVGAAATPESGPVPVVPDLDDVLGSIDALVVLTRDADAHAALAVPALRAGVDVFVDKPLARRVADLDLMLAAAASGGRLTSASALRYHPAVPRIVGSLRQRDIVRSLREPEVPLEVCGPADLADPHGGVTFYGTHAVELALALDAATRPRPDTVVQQVVEPVVEHVVVEQVEVTPPTVTVRLATPRPLTVRLGPDLPFGVTVGAGRRRESFRLDLGPGYLDPVLDRLTAFVRGGPPLAPMDQLVDVVRVLEAVDLAVASRPGQDQVSPPHQRTRG